MIILNLRLFFVLLITCVFLESCTKIDKFPIAFLGLDGSGKEFHIVAPGKLYNKKSGKYLESISKESMLVLDEHTSPSSWYLKRVDIGLGVTAKLGFAVVSVDATPSFRLTFKKK